MPNFQVVYDQKYRRQILRNTRSADKINFKVPHRFSHIYEHSPYYIGTRVGNKLPARTQKANNTCTFKMEISKLYKKYMPTK